MQEQLVEILKHKGIGPKGSKHISKEECESVYELILNPSCSLTTKATFLTALFLLDKDENETVLCSQLVKNVNAIDTKLHFIILNKTQNEIERIIVQAIARQDLNESDAKKGIELSFDLDTPEYLTASFLEALRLKRETNLENKVFYEYFLSKSERIVTNYDQLIEIGDSYDGVVRNNNYNLFTACVLASLGHKVLLSGNYTVAPKNGFTHHQVLLEANKNPLLSLEKSKEHLDTFGWVYLDQSVFYPSLWNERQMRAEMVKRPCIATFEKILSPIASQNGNDIITSYTHAHYKHANVEILRNSPYCKSALNIKGLEGTITPKHNVSTPVVKLENGEVSENNYKFSDSELNSVDNLNAKETLSQGVDFLENGANNQASQYISNTCALILTSLGYVSTQEEALTLITESIESGKAYELWEKSLTK